MMSVSEKSKILGRIDDLLLAVKKARQRANNVDVQKVNVGAKLLNYINNG